MSVFVYLNLKEPALKKKLFHGKNVMQFLVEIGFGTVCVRYRLSH